MRGETLIRNAGLWAPGAAEIVEDGAVLVRDGRIVRVGRFRERARTEIDADGALLLPGLIQAHVHLCQTLFRGLAEDRPLLDWLGEVVWPLEAAHDAASLRASARLAAAEMLRGGVTAFQSMETVRGTGAVFEAVEETGLMGVIGHCLMDESGGFAPLAVDPDEALAECDALLHLWGGHDRLRLAVAPRFALSCQTGNLRLAARYARENGLRLHTHAAEQVAEVDLVRRRTGQSNIEYLHGAGLTGPDVALAHCVHPAPGELDLLAATGTGVLHCPSANLKLGSGVAPVPEMLDAGIPVGLGADGAACNNRLDLFMEMRLAGLIQKPRRGPAALPAADVVRMATEGGARTMGWADELGALAEGRRANLILVDRDSLSAVPSDDPAANLVYAHGAADVVLTMVNGEVLFANGELTRLDEDAIRREAREQRALLLARAGLDALA